MNESTNPPPLDYAQPRPEQLEALRAGERAATKIRRATRFARGDAWTLAVAAGLTLITGYNDLSAILLGALLAVICWSEFRGATELSQFNLAAPRRLAINQMLLAGTITLYCIWRIYVTRNAPSSISKELADADPQVAEMLGSDLANMERTVYLWLYVTAIFATCVGQGCIAVYYDSRRKIVERYLQDTPLWVVDFQRRGLNLKQYKP